MYLNCANMHPLGFNGLIDCRLLKIFEPGVYPVWIMCATTKHEFTFRSSFITIILIVVLWYQKKLLIRKTI